MFLRGSVAGALAVFVAASAAPVVTTVQAAGVPAFDHVFVIVMENHAYSEIIGSSAAPYTNSLLASGALATNYHGVTHPSLPNYLALAGGSTYGITSDCTTCWISAANIADNLENAGKSAGEQGFARAGRPDQQNIALFDIDLAMRIRRGVSLAAMRGE